MSERERIKVLLVEDSPDDAALVTRSVRALASRAEVDIAPTLGAALDRLEQMDYDRVLLDLHLPDATPADACRRVLDAAGAAIVVAISGTDLRPEDAEAVSTLGGFWTKAQIAAGAQVLSTEPPPLEGMPLRILLVEDDLDLAQLVCITLHDAGLVREIVHAGSLGAALDELQGFRPDVVMLDLGLPDSESKLGTIDRMHAALPDTPLVVLTGLSEAFALQAERRGAADFIPKSIFSSGFEATRRIFQRVLPRVYVQAEERRRAEEEAERAGRIDAHRQGIRQRFAEVRALLKSAQDGG